MESTKKRIRHFIYLGFLLTALAVAVAQKAKETYRNPDKSPLHNFVIK
jgi:hypothetical protein